MAGHLLIIDALFEPDRDSGSLRMSRLLSVLNDLGWSTDYFIVGSQYSNACTQGLLALGIDFKYFPDRQTLIEFLKKESPAYQQVVLSRIDVAHVFYDTIRTIFPEARLIFDTVDLHHLRFYRQARLTNNAAMLKQALLYKTKELTLARQADMTLVVSDYEQQLLKEETDKSVELVPNIHQMAEQIKPFETRCGFLFLGNFQHQPNIDAIEYFVSEVWPSVQQILPEHRLYIVGSRPTQAVKRLACDRIKVTGYVDDIKPYLDTCLCSVVPLRYGAGVKGKIGSSLSHGLPVVLTSIAAEGMGLVDDHSALFADDHQGFASALHRLASDVNTWQKISQNGYNHIASSCSVATITNKLKKLFGVPLNDA